MKTVKTGIGNLFLWFGDNPGKEKITIGGTEPGVHYTIMFRRNRRTIDIHKTIEGNKNNCNKYEPLLEMRLFTFMRFLVSLRKINLKLLQDTLFSNKINLGKLRRRNSIFSLFESNKIPTKILVSRERSKKLRFASEIDVEHLSEMILYHDQVIRSEESSFLVYSTRKGRGKLQGLIFRQAPFMRQFYFVKINQFYKYQQLLQLEMSRILKTLTFKIGSQNPILSLN